MTFGPEVNTSGGMDLDWVPEREATPHRQRIARQEGRRVG